MFRKIRIILGVVTLTLITFLFLDFSSLIPAEKIPIAKIQFVPALLSLSVGILVALLLLTLVLGRVYCSVICPLGVFQDVASRVSRLFVKKKKRFHYSPERKIIRYTVLALVVGTWLAGWSFLLGLLDPYGAYGRIATHLFRPVYLEGNNIIASLFNHFGVYTFYKADLFLLSASSLIVALLTFLIVGYLAWRYGRIWCNTFCPVGTVLGVLSRYSMFRIRFNDSCNHCGACSSSCKASCIDSKKETVDASRCVTCFNCTEVCKQNALTYSFAWKGIGNKEVAAAPSNPDDSRRRFLGTAGLTLLAAGTKIWAVSLPLKTNKPWTRKHPLSPPGSKSFSHLDAHCTSCHLCVSRCPSNVLKPSFMEYGLGGMMQPMMDFSHGFCNYDCTICSTVCPNGALKPLTVEQKHETQMGFVVFLRNNCVVYTDETFCGACSEHCPTQAVRMVPYKNDLTIPEVNPEICVGCGGCEYICPAKPSKAIFVQGNPVHQKAKAFEDKKQEDVKVDSFGF
jgi:polyferredoxin